MQNGEHEFCDNIYSESLCCALFVVHLQSWRCRAFRWASSSTVIFRSKPEMSTSMLRVTGHFGIKTLWDTSAPISRQFDTKNVVRDISTRVPWSRKSRDTSTQDNSDETQLHRWFLLNFGTDFIVLKCFRAEVSCGRSVRLPCWAENNSLPLTNGHT